MNDGQNNRDDREMAQLTGEDDWQSKPQRSDTSGGTADSTGSGNVDPFETEVSTSEAAAPEEPAPPDNSEIPSSNNRQGFTLPPGQYSPFSHPRTQREPLRSINPQQMQPSDNNANNTQKDNSFNHIRTYDKTRDDYWNQKPQKKNNSGITTAFVLICFLLLVTVTIAFAGSEREQSSTPSLGSPPGFNIDPSIPDYPNYGDFIWSPDDYGEQTLPRGVNDFVERAPIGTGVTMSIAAPTDSKDLTTQQIYQKCSPAVVGITASYDSEGSYFWGTGIIFNSDGYILTNYHIIDGTYSAEVTLNDNRKFTAMLVGADSRSDLAILKIDAHDLPVAEFGDSAALEVGESVVAIGNPLGVELRNTITNGIISAINRDIDYDGHRMTLLQTNAAINEGNSGGPLINMSGQVVGVTNMKMISYYVTVEGIAFAIPTSSIVPVVNQLIELGYVPGRPAIGITTSQIPTDVPGYNDLPDGIYVHSVFQNTDAYKKGIKVGDIIVAVEGEPVYSTADINFIKDFYEVGETLSLTIFRNNETFDIEIELCDMNDLQD